MLNLIDTAIEKIYAQEKLEARLQKSWQGRETRIVVWRPDSRRITVHHNGRYWYGSLPLGPKEVSIPHRWYPFGEYRESGDLDAAVELNVPWSNDKRVSGFFARDAETGAVYLMHDGGVGGGRKSVGRIPFLAWSNSKLVPVAGGDDIRPAVVVAPVDASSTAVDVARFVQLAIDFKEAAARGETTTPRALAAQRRFGTYFDEFSGKKRRRRLEEIEYISRHGDIVRAVHDWRERKLRSNKTIFKDGYVDLGVHAGGVLREIYEVKSSCERQSLYTAIGQIVVHDDTQSSDCRPLVCRMAKPSPQTWRGLSLARTYPSFGSRFRGRRPACRSRSLSMFLSHKECDPMRSREARPAI
ncbi:hypothetical protein [Bradyrhizobium australafricanum]|uniref:hypothetical protein n=1 Tax=Bradyrhizobium australafricanum TaxID=2821406 RepID=UPI001CE30160|nr:hypothetical protein [Bradyrhizobium australafricanum]MCA6105296.1 hypothetical protein [Bradyrhizobium australafricanum]